MEVAGSVFAGMSVASMLVSSGITVSLTEGAGNLFESGAISTTDDSPKLQGRFSDAVRGMSATTIGLSVGYLGFYSYGMYKYRKEHHAIVQKIYWTILLLAIIMAIISSALNINLVEGYTNYLDDGQLQTDPSIVIPGENFKLRGAVGTGVFGMAVVTLIFASLGIIQMATAWGMSKNMSLKQGVPASPSIVAEPAPDSLDTAKLSQLSDDPFGTPWNLQSQSKPTIFPYDTI